MASACHQCGPVLLFTQFIKAAVVHIKRSFCLETEMLLGVCRSSVCVCLKHLTFSETDPMLFFSGLKEKPSKLTDS